MTRTITKQKQLEQLELLEQQGRQCITTRTTRTIKIARTTIKNGITVTKSTTKKKNKNN